MGRWEATKVKYVCREVDVRHGGDELPLLSVSIHRGVVPRAEITDRESRAEDVTGYKRCQPADIVLNRMSAYQGAVGISRAPGLVTPEYMVLRAIRPVEPRFLHHLFKSTWFVSEMTSRLRGIGAIDQGNVRTPRIYWGDLGSIALNVPHAREQRAIADFLDRETVRIDTAIRRHVRLEYLCEERYRGALNELFRRPDWPVTRLKHLLAARPSYGVLVPRFVEEGGTRFIRVSDLSALESRADELIEIDQTQSGQYRRTIVVAGDVLVSVVGSLDRVAVVPSNVAGSNIARAVARLQPREVVAPELLAAWAGTEGYAEQAADATTDDSVQPTLNMGDLANFELRFPAARNSQEVALEAFRKLSLWRSGLKAKIAQQVALLREHRQALITAAVTGQMGVEGKADHSASK